MAFPSKIEKTIAIGIFGDLVATHKARKCYTMCTCSCGNEKAIKAADLLEGLVTHCGCKADKRTKAMIKVDDAVNTRFRKDMLLAESRDELKTTRQKSYINMRCDCGNLKSFTYQGVLNLEYGSCGCYKPKEIKPSPASQKALETETFTYWNVTGWAEDDPRYVYCSCKCGNNGRIRSDSLLAGGATSCGCRARELCSLKFKGKFKPDAVTRHPLYSIYKGMCGRCFSESSTDFKHYGGRGIIVTDRWLSP